MTKTPQHQAKHTADHPGTPLKKSFPSFKRKNPRRADGDVPPPPTPATSADAPNNDTSSSANPIDDLISELKEHMNQGRIFDARTVVHKLQDAEKEQLHCPTTTKLDPIRPLMSEVLTQSTHVEDLLHDLHSNDNWTLAKEKAGVTVHYRREENSPIHLVRAQATFTKFVPKDFVRLCSLFVETECMPLWFPGGIMRKANVLSWHSKYSKVIQLHIALQLLPMLSSRDAVVYGNGYHLPDRNAFLISSKSILEDTCRYCDIPPPAKGVVRMETESIFYVELVKSDVIAFKLIGRDDLKFKFMPSTLLNYISQGHMPFDLIKSIQRTIRNFHGSVWEQKIKERGAYYSEIEDKVLVQLDAWEKEGNKGKTTEQQPRGGEDEVHQRLIEKYKWMEEDKHHLSLLDESRQLKNRRGLIVFVVTLLVLIGVGIYSQHHYRLPVPTSLSTFFNTLGHLLPMLDSNLRWSQQYSRVKSLGILAGSLTLPLMIYAFIKSHKNTSQELSKNTAKVSFDNFVEEMEQSLTSSTVASMDQLPPSLQHIPKSSNGTISQSRQPSATEQVEANKVNKLKSSRQKSLKKVAKGLRKAISMRRKDGDDGTGSVHSA